MSQSMMFPAEIWLRILSEMTPAAQADLALTCRSLYEVAIQGLYGNITMIWNKGKSRPPRIHLLLRTVLERPSLARLTHSASFQGDSYDKSQYASEDYLAQMDFGSTDEDGLVKVISKVGLPSSPPLLHQYWLGSSGSSSESSWVDLLQKGHVELYQSLLISQLPNLRALSIDYNAYGSFDFLRSMIEYAFASGLARARTTGFHSLRHVTLCIDMDSRDLSGFGVGDPHHTVESIQSFLYLPKLETLRAIVPESGAPLAWPASTPSAALLSKLQLCRSDIETDALGELLSTTANLKELEYDLCRKTHINFLEGIPYLKCSDLTRAFNRVSGSLESLKVYVQLYEYDMWWDELNIMKGIEGWVDCSNLERLLHIEMPTVLMLGPYVRNDSCFTDRLPISLGSLTLNDDMALFHAYPWRGPRLLRCIEQDLMKHPSQKASQFKSLLLQIRESENDWDDNLQEEFHHICRQFGFLSEIKKCLRTKQ